MDGATKPARMYSRRVQRNERPPPPCVATESAAGNTLRSLRRCTHRVFSAALAIGAACERQWRSTTASIQHRITREFLSHRIPTEREKEQRGVQIPLAHRSCDAESRLLIQPLRDQYFDEARLPRLIAL